MATTEPCGSPWLISQVWMRYSELAAIPRFASAASMIARIACNYTRAVSPLRLRRRLRGLIQLAVMQVVVSCHVLVKRSRLKMSNAQLAEVGVEDGRLEKSSP